MLLLRLDLELRTLPAVLRPLTLLAPSMGRFVAVPGPRAVWPEGRSRALVGSGPAAEAAGRSEGRSGGRSGGRLTTLAMALTDFSRSTLRLRSSQLTVPLLLAAPLPRTTPPAANDGGRCRCCCCCGRGFPALRLRNIILDEGARDVLMMLLLGFWTAIISPDSEGQIYAKKGIIISCD